jgi:catechol 2,3-dioxygenase-like lactoylglutathione lyase family enzyme
MIRPIDVAHVNLNVTDLGRSVAFYTTVLGLRVALQYEQAVAWLNFGQYEEGVVGLGRGFHDVALYQVPLGLPEDYRRRAGLNHLALRLRTPEEVDAAAEFLRAEGVKILKGPLTHKEDNDRYLYLEDPDGNVVELVSSVLPNWPSGYLRARNRTPEREPPSA